MAAQIHDDGRGRQSPLVEHPFGGSWRYQVTSYFAPTSRYGTPDDFRYLVDHLHGLGIGVILDWVPAHFPRDAWALARFDGTPLYEHAEPRRGEHPDWGTYIFDHGRREVRDFLIASALYWLEELHLDALRVDAVEFLRELTATVRRRCPGTIVFAEESTAWPGVTHPDGLGFAYKWNMGWMHDTLAYLSHDPVHRAHQHHRITFSAEYAWDERHLLPLSHDEVVHGKGSLWQRMPGDDGQRAAGLRGLLGYMWAHPGKKLLFMGGEFGQVAEWDAGSSLAWDLLHTLPHRGVRRLVADLNARYRSSPALYTQDTLPAGFSWIRAGDAEHNVLAFLRHGADGTMLACVVNFAGVTHDGYRIGLPHAGRWIEALNTDLAGYGGSGVGNGPAVTATAVPADGLPASAVLRLPAHATLWLTREVP